MQHLLRDLIYDWELFANSAELRIPPLIQCAMLHCGKGRRPATSSRRSTRTTTATDASGVC